MFKKSFLIDQDYNEILKTIKPELRILLLFTNLSCNARCNFCHIWGDDGWALNNISERSLEQINLERTKRFIDDALKTNGKPFWVMLTGGEPTLYNNFENLIIFLKSRKLPIILLTNGFNLTDQAEFFVKYQINNISISLDGPPYIHNKIRNINNLYEKVVNGIEEIIKLKYQNKSVYPMLFLNCVISEHTINTLREFTTNLKREFQEKGINLKFNMSKMGSYNDVGMRFEPLLHTTKRNVQNYIDEMKVLFNKEVSSTPYSFIHDNSNLDLNPVKEFLEKFWSKSGVEVSSLIDLNEYFHNIDNTFNHKRCFAPWNSLIVRQNGDTYFCPDFKDYKLGNIYEESFERIWIGENAIKFREILKSRLLSLCNRCGGLYTEYQYLSQSRPIG